MPKRKRIWWRIQNEIVEKEGKNGDEVWQELSDAVKGFGQLHDSCFFAKWFGITKWYKEFLRMLEGEAMNLGHWKVVASMSEVGSACWKRAIKNIYHETKGTDIFYRWQELRRMLPKDHPLVPETKRQMSRIRAEKKAKKINYA